jgi:DinB superfamily
MSETAQQYTQRILNHLGTMDPIDVMESTILRLEALVLAMERKELQNKPSPDKWSATEILTHLAESEIVYGYRIRKALNATGQPIEATDQKVWVKNAGYLQSDPHLALSLFQVLRRANISVLRSLKSEQLEHFGIHSERGKESIAQMARMIAGHDINHLQQLESRVEHPVS